MNEKSIQILEKYLPKTYVNQGQQAISSLENEIRVLLEKGKIPEKGWSDERIEFLLNYVAFMDSNNFSESCGLGEREGRVFSRLVSKRHYNFAHGIGRSGDLNEIQPKAIGSSLINRLTNDMIMDFVKISGLTFAKKCFLVPMATGMTLTFCMLSIRQTKPNAKYVLMPRIDQKSCIKSIVASGFTAVIIENKLVGEELQTDMNALEAKIAELKPENIACIFSVTSCFAPRAADNVEGIAKLCAQFNIFHLVNNAYGLQSSKCTHSINQASRNGRVDVVVQSTDKNLMVPVGGSLLVAFDEKNIDNITGFYPGRASMSQTLDVLITLLSMGTDKYRALLLERKDCFDYLKKELKRLADKHGEKVLDTPHNSISIGFTLTHYGDQKKEITQIGSMLFIRFVSGARVVASGENKEIGGIKFQNFGSHSNDYPCAYVTAAAAIGETRDDIDMFIKRFGKVLDSFKAQKVTSATTTAVENSSNKSPPLTKAASHGNNSHKKE